MRIRLVEDAQHVASMASQRFVTEDYAVAYLADQGTAAQLRGAALEIKTDPDARRSSRHCWNGLLSGWRTHLRCAGTCHPMLVMWTGRVGIRSDGDARASDVS